MFIWATGSAAERADMVRSHMDGKISDDKICKLFNLTPTGLAWISNGQPWKPEYSNDIEEGD